MKIMVGKSKCVRKRHISWTTITKLTCISHDDMANGREQQQSMPRLLLQNHPIGGFLTLDKGMYRLRSRARITLVTNTMNTVYAAFSKSVCRYKIGERRREGEAGAFRKRKAHIITKTIMSLCIECELHSILFP